MKTIKKQVLIISMAILLFNCSSEDDVTEEIISKCFVIKDKDTDLPIANSSITFYDGELYCAFGGCGYGEVTRGNSDEDGKVCIDLTKSDFGAVAKISCSWDNKYREVNIEIGSLLNLDVIYVDTLY